MNILVLIPASKKHKAELEGAAPDAEFAYSSIEAATDKQVASADVIVGNLPAARLHTASHLQLIQLNSAGYDKYAAPGAACRRRALLRNGRLRPGGLGAPLCRDPRRHEEAPRLPRPAA